MAKFLFSPPEDQLQIIKRYQKIHDYLVMDWGTVRLKKFLDDLICGEGNVGRQGFPHDVSAALLSLSLLNIQHLEAQGLNFDENPVSQFTLTGWEIPSNF